MKIYIYSWNLNEIIYLEACSLFSFMKWYTFLYLFINIYMHDVVGCCLSKIEKLLILSVIRIQNNSETCKDT